MWHVPDLGKLKTPENLRALRAGVAARRGVIDLLDFLKESDFVTQFTDDFSTVDTRENTPREVIRERLLRSALVFVNTVLVQSLLKDPAWADRLTDADRRALSPLFWSHADLYGTIQIEVALCDDGDGV
ncbi:Tn3 family transposase [Sphaerisporangium sp. NBC_01403]|uniref:Tn3 family transposase n=1 Tax=Sphaerisporangium sp. NBC_01403 TaxID=2903599 RepID=UPI003244F674